LETSRKRAGSGLLTSITDTANRLFWNGENRLTRLDEIGVIRELDQLKSTHVPSLVTLKNTLPSTCISSPSIGFVIVDIKQQQQRNRNVTENKNKQTEIDK